MVVVFRPLLLGARSRMALIKIWTVCEGRIQKKKDQKERKQVEVILQKNTQTYN